MEFKYEMMETEEYKTLYKNAKLAYPEQYDYFIHLACIDYFMEKENIKSDVNIDSDEIQEINSA